jgi:hypothetical protein
MPETQQRTKLIAVDDAGNDYEYLETFIPFDGENYHEWVVEVLPEQRFWLWRIQGFHETGVASYSRREECSEAELESAGYADQPRVKRPAPGH